MKIAESEVIKNGERELIDTITGDLDWETIEKLLLKKHNFRLQEDVEYKSGDIVVHNNAIAYKLDFDVKVSLSVLFNRNGECLELSTSGEVGAEAEGENASEEVAFESRELPPGNLTSRSPDDPEWREKDTGEAEKPGHAKAEFGFEDHDGDVEAVMEPAGEPGEEVLPELMMDDEFEALEPVLGLDLDDDDLDFLDLDGSPGGAPQEPLMEADSSVSSGSAAHEPDTGGFTGGKPGVKKREQITEMASQIADMISEINEE